MSRVKPLENREMGLLGRVLMAAARWKLGKVPAPMRIMAHNPAFLLPYVGMGAFAQGRTELPPEIRSLAMHLVARINGCDWCIDFSSAVSQKSGWDRRKLGAVEDFATSPLFTPPERAALAFAFEASQVGARVSDETFAELRHHFSERAVVELAAAVAAEHFFNRMNATLGVEDQGFCELPAFSPQPIRATV
jgi:AhpD family alkylhydroperoxidase